MNCTKFSQQIVFLAKEKSHHLMSGTKSNFLAARKKFKEEKAKKRKSEKERKEGRISK